MSEEEEEEEEEEVLLLDRNIPSSLYQIIKYYIKLFIRTNQFWLLHVFCLVVVYYVHACYN